MANNEKMRTSLYQKKQRMLEILDEETEFKYKEIIERRKLKNEATFLLENGNAKEVLNRKYRSVFKEYSLFERLKIRIKAMFPFLVTIKNKLRK